MFRFNRKILSVVSILLSLMTTAFADTLDASIERGKYLAVAADCLACHTNPKSDSPEPFAGGLPFQLPMGIIISSNITPSKTDGIGNYSFDDFKRALTKGKSPDRTLYPAMPYTEYHKIKEEDLKDLYSYFMNKVDVVEQSPSEKTALNFPFSLPGLMPIWNMLFVGSGEFVDDPALSSIENRGKYLADHLAHCTTCHTPRNSLMGPKNSQYLAGGFANGWFAPNITSDKESGIGEWSEADIIQLLREGELPGITQVGGQMAEAIEHSFRHLKEADIIAIARYLKTIPAVSTATAMPVTQSDKAIDLATLEPSAGIHSGNLGADIYQGACSTCHGISGAGSRDKMLPPLKGNRIFTYPNSNNVVLAIAEGIERRGATSESSMPAFGVKVDSISNFLSNEEIAEVSNYVINQFGAGNSQLTSADVELIRAGGAAPLLITLAPYLAIILPILFLIIIVRLFRRKKS